MSIIDLLTLAEQQHGLIHVEQAGDLGLRRWLHHRVGTGEWVSVTRTVKRRAGAPPTADQAVMAAALDLGARCAASHDTAAALWGIVGFRPIPHHLTMLRNVPGRRTALATVHEPRLLHGQHVGTIRGIPVTTPARTIFDLAGCRRITDIRLERTLDACWSAGLVSWPALERMLAELSRRGRAGIRRMRALLDDRGPDYLPPESGLEHRFAQILADADLAGFDRQVELSDELGWIGRVDFLHRELRIVIEVDHRRFHGSLTDQAADAARDARLRAAGYLVLRVTDHEIWHEPRPVVQRVREAMRSRRVQTHQPIRTGGQPNASGVGVAASSFGSNRGRPMSWTLE